MINKIKNLFCDLIDKIIHTYKKKHTRKNEEKQERKYIKLK